MLSASCDTNDAMVSHEQKSNVTPHFSCLDLRNAVVPFKMPSALHNASGSVNGVTSHDADTNGNGINWC